MEFCCQVDDSARNREGREGHPWVGSGGADGGSGVGEEEEGVGSKRLLGTN